MICEGKVESDADGWLFCKTQTKCPKKSDQHHFSSACLLKKGKRFK